MASDCSETGLYPVIFMILGVWRESAMPKMALQKTHKPTKYANHTGFKLLDFKHLLT